MSLDKIIDAAWEDRANISTATEGEIRKAVDTALAGLDKGEFRIAEKKGDTWTVHQWLKKAVLLSFRLNPNQQLNHGPDNSHWWDKVPVKTSGWTDADFTNAAFRSVPGSIVRKGAFIGSGVILMPSF